MNAISKLGWALALAAAIPTTAFAAPAPYENAVSKAMHPGKPHIARVTPAPRAHTQPRMYVQPRMNTAPQVAATRAADARRTFSYEPAAPVATAPAAQRRTFSYEPAPAYVAPRARRGYTHTYENATMKGLGQIR